MVKTGLIGVGHLGKIHLKLLKQIETIEVVGFYDTNAENSEKVANEFHVKRYANVDTLIDDCDAVVVVTPTIYHYEYAAKAIKKSKHVFIEKPISTTLNQAKKIMELAKEANVKVQIGHVERFNPAFLIAKKYCAHPMFVESHRLAQFNPRGTDVSVVLDLMIHDIDIVLSVIKSNIKKISASGVAVVSDTPDIANARIEFDNGSVANLTASRISMKNMRKSRFFQRDAYISVDFLEKNVSVVRLRNIAPGEEEDPLSMVIDLGNEKGKKQIYFEAPEVEPNNAIKMELELFAESILNNTTPPVTVDDGYHALDIAYKIIDKLKRMSNLTED